MMLLIRQFDGSGVHIEAWLTNINLGIVSMYTTGWLLRVKWNGRGGGIGRNTGALQVNK